MVKEHRTFKEECIYIERLNENSFLIKKGFVPKMKVEGIFYINKLLEKLMFDELKYWAGTQGSKGVGKSALLSRHIAVKATIGEEDWRTAYFG
nr:RNA-splicing ligase RtcB homolog [Pocillopora verrucosa]